MNWIRNQPCRIWQKGTKSAGPQGQSSLFTVNRGYWSPLQNMKYRLFLQFHHLQFQNRKTKRADRLFLEMSLYLSTRESHQCRSHHQKMEKKFGNLENIVEYLRSKQKESQERDLQEQRGEEVKERRYSVGSWQQRTGWSFESQDNLLDH